MVTAMSGMAEQLEPPKHLRERVLASVRPPALVRIDKRPIGSMQRGLDSGMRSPVCIYAVVGKYLAIAARGNKRADPGARPAQVGRRSIEPARYADRAVRKGKRCARKSVPEPQWRRGIRRLAIAATG